jgi:hypothetical protein
MNKRWLYTALALIAPFGFVDAKCLPNSDIDHPCRYIQGDSWCAKRGGGNLYAYSDSCLGQASTSNRRTQPDVSGLIGLRQGMDYSQARQIILGAGWQGNNKRWQEILKYGQEHDVYYNNGWREVASCAGTGTAPCRFEFNDIHGNLLVVITEGECLNEQMEGLKKGETCDLPVSSWFLE